MGRRRDGSMAATADRHYLYQEAVQDPVAEIDFIEETWRTLRDRPAELLREDFCGTAHTACEWVRRDVGHWAVGIDLGLPGNGAYGWFSNQTLTSPLIDLRGRSGLVQVAAHAEIGEAGHSHAPVTTGVAPRKRFQVQVHIECHAVVTAASSNPETDARQLALAHVDARRVPAAVGFDAPMIGKAYDGLLESDSTDVDALVGACENMGRNGTGALLVIERDTSLDFIRSSGDSMEIEVNKPIIESIFFKNSPLHDGAAIIKGNYIVATRVILPVSRERSIPQRFGLRHRAAVGITERTDALALVVSEETGLISYIKNGEFVLFKDMEELDRMIRKDLST